MTTSPEDFAHSGAVSALPEFLTAILTSTVRKTYAVLSKEKEVRANVQKTLRLGLVPSLSLLALVLRPLLLVR